MRHQLEQDSFKIDTLCVRKFSTRDDLDACAGAEAAQAITAAIKTKGEARIILASAPSQTGFLKALLSQSVD